MPHGLERRRDVPQRAEHEEYGYIGRRIVDGHGRVAHAYTPRRALLHINVIVARAVVA